MRSWRIVAATLLMVVMNACSGGGGGGGSGTMPTGDTSALDMSASVALTADQTAQPQQIFAYSFALPSGQQSFLGLEGELSMVSQMPVFNQSLMTVATIASGACPASGTVFANYAALYNAFPTLEPLQGFILKNPNQGTASVMVDFQLPVGVAVSNCVVLLMDWEGDSAVTLSSTLSMTYAAAPTSALATLLPTNQEFAFGENAGPGSTTDDSLSFVQETAITQAGTILAFVGDISDSAFSNGDTPVPAPAGAWQTMNDIYLVPGGCPANIAVNSSGYTDQAGNYYAEIPANAQHLLSVPLSGSGMMGVTQAVYSQVNVAVQAGDCLLTLFGLDAAGGGGIDAETQVKALFLASG